MAVAEVNRMMMAVVKGTAVDTRCHCWKGVACKSAMRLDMVNRLVLGVGPGVKTMPKAVVVKVNCSNPYHWLAVDYHCAL